MIVATDNSIRLGVPEEKSIVDQSFTITNDLTHIYLAMSNYFGLDLTLVMLETAAKNFSDEILKGM